MSYSIIIVDDEVMTRQMLRMLLELQGFEVIEAEDGIEALERTFKHRPDIMILDVMMPRMDGLTACRKLRSRPETAEMPVIMLSGKTQSNAAEEGLAAGADLYMSKPMKTDQLLSALRELLASGRSVSTPA
jgi:DNA-binding response OmpR family regulator